MRTSTIIAWVSASLLAAPAIADELQLIEGFDGYQGVRDNTMFSEYSTRSNGAGDHLFTGNTLTGFSRRALIRFDLTDLPLPPDAVLTAAELRLVVSRTRAFQPAVTVHRVLEDWGEGAEDASGPEGDGASAQVGSATWTDNFYTLSAWGASGGTFDATPSASSIGVFSGNPMIWNGPNMLADVQAWIDDPPSNFGWIVVGDESGTQTAVRFYSADNDESAIREQFPRLTLQYASGPIDLAVTPLHRGEPATFTASNVIPGYRTYFLYSFAGAGNTFVPQLGIALDMERPIVNFANALADDAGVATWTGTVPPIAPLTTISFQAVHLRPNEVARKSNRVDTEILP
ncbi:MAG: DNRLRE domain-containing protein [Phycisphaerales bacterium]